MNAIQGQFSSGGHTCLIYVHTSVFLYTFPIQRGVSQFALSPHCVPRQEVTKGPSINEGGRGGGEGRGGRGRRGEEGGGGGGRGEGGGGSASPTMLKDA